MNMENLANTKSGMDNTPINSTYKKQATSTGQLSTLKSSRNDVQRAIEGLKEIPDEELQEFLNDDEFMEGLNVVDAWVGDEDRNSNTEHKSRRVKDHEQKHLSRDRHRRDRKGSYNRERPKREEKKREEIRRDPSKSTKDIERDKLRTRKDNESKLLAEKEKAIKHLLDSDNVVPPGTESEAIKSIAEKQHLERTQMRLQKSRERRRSIDRTGQASLRRKSLERIRISSPRQRTPIMLSPERRRSSYKRSTEKYRSPLRFSAEKRRSPVRFHCDRRSPLAFTPERTRSPGKRLSWERRTSLERRWSIDRHRRRTNIHERRRSRSRDRQRSRSVERLRRKPSRSPIGRRYSPRRRIRSHSKSSERRKKKRSPFLNEIARQLRNESILTPHPRKSVFGTTSLPIDELSSLMNATVYQQKEAESCPPTMLTSSYSHQTVLATAIPPAMPMNGPSFVSYEIPVQTMNFDSVPLHTVSQTEYSSGPIMYNHANTGSMIPPIVPSPQPVPAPASTEHVCIPYSSRDINVARQSPIQTAVPLKKSTNILTSTSTTTPSYKDRSSTTLYNGYRPTHEERVKTPEPPVISDTKQFEKTSLSSLLEASVSAKDSSVVPVLYPGFKPEVLRHCEHALRELPIEDPRLNMKGRFFYHPRKEDAQNDNHEHFSNSILLQKNKNKIYWKVEEEEQHFALPKQTVPTHKKICQTDIVETDTKSVQTDVTMIDSAVQVYPQDLQYSPKEEKRPIMDRLDWNTRETFDHAPKIREADDLRWSLSNSSQKRSWSRTVSPHRGAESHEHRLDPISVQDHSTRSFKPDSPINSRDSFGYRKGSIRDRYGHERYSLNYRHAIEERDEVQETRNDRSRGESPMMLEDSGEELEVVRAFQRETGDWRGRGKPVRGRSYPLIKPHLLRGKQSGSRPYGGRGSFRGKF